MRYQAAMEPRYAKVGRWNEASLEWGLLEHLSMGGCGLREDALNKLYLGTILPVW